MGEFFHNKDRKSHSNYDIKPKNHKGKDWYINCLKSFLKEEKEMKILPT